MAEVGNFETLVQNEGLDPIGEVKFKPGCMSCTGSVRCDRVGIDARAVEKKCCRIIFRSFALTVSW